MPRRALAFGLIASIQFTLILAITVVTVALPALQRDLALTRADLVFFSAAYGLSFSGFLLLGGRLADQLGYRRVFGLGLIIFGAGSAAAGMAPAFGVLLSGRLVQGIGAALAAPAAMALIGVIFPDPVRRVRALAIWGGLASAGAAGGILLSGVVVTLWSWRWAFALPVPVAAFAALAAPRLLPADRPPLRVRLDPSGALLLTAGQIALGYGLSLAGDRPWSSTVVLSAVLAGVGLLAAFVMVDARAREPLLPWSFFRSGSRLMALLAVLLASAGSATVLFFLVLYFQQIQDLSPLRTSAAFLPYVVVLAGTGWIAGRLVALAGPRLVTATGLAVAAVGLLLLSRLAAEFPYGASLWVGLLIFPLGIGFAFAGAMVAGMAALPAERAGAAGGVVNTALELGPALGLALLASLAAAHTAWLSDAGIAATVATTRGYAFALTITAIVFSLAALLAAVVIGTDQTRVPRSPGAPIPNQSQ